VAFHFKKLGKNEKGNAYLLVQIIFYAIHLEGIQTHFGLLLPSMLLKQVDGMVCIARG
jgi:hypothetical protein